MDLGWFTFVPSRRPDPAQSQRARRSVNSLAIIPSTFAPLYGYTALRLYGSTLYGSAALRLYGCSRIPLHLRSSCQSHPPGIPMFHFCSMCDCCCCPPPVAGTCGPPLSSLFCCGPRLFLKRPACIGLLCVKKNSKGRNTHTPTPRGSGTRNPEGLPSAESCLPEQGFRLQPHSRSLACLSLFCVRLQLLLIVHDYTVTAYNYSYTQAVQPYSRVLPGVLCIAIRLYSR